jgi:hemerythrin
MEQFKWRDEYEIGEEHIDCQHRHLFVLVNRIVDPENSNEVHSNFMALFKYVREHFRDEEAIMKNAGYPGYEGHRVEHEQLLDRLVELGVNIGKGNIDVQAMTEFMSRWVLIHIGQEDMLIGEFLRKQGHS